jgi:hypothetical protein
MLAGTYQIHAFSQAGYGVDVNMPQQPGQRMLAGRYRDYLNVIVLSTRLPCATTAGGTAPAHHACRRGHHAYISPSFTSTTNSTHTMSECKICRQSPVCEPSSPCPSSNVAL